MDNIDENIEKIKFFKGMVSDRVQHTLVEERLAGINCFTAAEQKKIAELLESKGIHPTGSDIAVIYAYGYSEIATRISILEEDHELDIYREDPSRINESAMDIHKKKMFCVINNIAYKDTNMKYKNFLFRKGKDEWNKIVARVNGLDFKAASNKDAVETVVEEEKNKPYEYDLEALMDSNESLQAKRKELVSSAEASSNEGIISDVKTISNEDFKNNFNNTLIYSFDELFSDGGVLAENEYGNDEFSYGSGRKAA